MLNKLKNKFILINMLTVGVVLLLIVLSFTVVTYKRKTEETERMVYDGRFEMIMKLPPQSEFPKDGIIVPTDIKVMFLDKNGNMGFANTAKDEESEYKEIFEKINRLDEEKGRAFGFIYAKYRIFENNFGNYTYCIVVSPLSSIYRETQGIFFIGLSIVLGAMCIFYFISRKLAEIAIKPTENTWTQQKRFIQDASHDLKTPLTVIMANNEILLSHCDETVEEQKKWLESTKNEGEHMKELINQMLDLAKSESLATNINIENVNVSELTESVALQLEPIAYEKNVDIIMQIENDIVLKSNKTEYTRLLYILVDNAIKYAPSETSIIVTLSKTKKQTTLCVNNKGNPIPKEDIKYIFDRFYRSDSARIKGGFGLGLSIAKNIVVALNGEITVNSNDNDGTTFIVKFK